MITLRTLGECIVEVDGEPLGPDADTAFAALVLLAAERDRQLSRRHIAELFWPGVAESRARHSLRQLLYRLRAFDLDLDAGREHIRLPAELIVPTFASDPTLERLRAAQASGTLVVGPCLPGYAPTFSPAFQEWLDGYRSVLEAQVRRTLLEGAREHQLRGEWTAADALARECLRIDPLNEAATLRRAECAAMMGGKAEALAILDRYNAEMGERGVEVALPTTVLRRRIAEQLPNRRYAIPSDRCFVGREAIMATLTVALLRAKNREGGTSLLWGAPGIGKTRITQELSAVAAVEGLRLVRVQCEESDARQPMSAWVDAVPQLLRLPGALGVSPDAMPFLKRLTEFDPTLREPSPEARDPQYLAGRIRQSIVDLVDAVSGEAPLFLLFEDVHWMDGASWAALRLLLEWAPSRPVLLVLTSRRPHATPAPPQREVPQLELHEVRALDGRAASQLVAAIAADFGGPMPEGAEAWCLTVGEGNPLFLRELVVDCLVEGQPRAVPPTVQTLLDARIARLRPGARQVLQACAILGEHATIERLEAVLQMPAYELVGALDELSEAGLIGGVGAAITPKHEVVAARIAGATSEAAKRLLHRRSASVLEASLSAATGLESMWATAAHWQASGHSQRALELAMAFGTQLLELALPNDVLAVCERAEALCTSRVEQFRVIRLRATAMHTAGRFAESLEVLLDLLSQERGEVSHSEWAADMLAAIEAEARAVGFTDTAAESAADIAADPSLDSHLRIRAAGLAVRIAANTGAVETARKAWSSVAAHIRADGDHQTDSIMLSVIFHVSFGNPHVGAAATKELAARARELPTQYSTLRVLLVLVDALRACTELDWASHTAERLFAISLRLGSTYHARRAALGCAEIALDRSQLATAQRWYSELSSLPRATSEHDVIGLEHRHVAARLHLLNGDARGAFAIAAATLQDGTLTGTLTPRHRRLILSTLIEAQLADSPDEVPQEFLTELLDLYTSTADDPLLDATREVIERALQRAGRHDEVKSVREAYRARREQREPSDTSVNAAS